MAVREKKTSRMGRSRAIASGAVALIGAQFAIAIGQIVYAGVTARTLSATDFAEFAVALNLLGLLNLFTTAGLASFTMAQSSITDSLISKVRLAAVSSGIVLGFIYIAANNIWSGLFGAPGASKFEFMLAVALAVSPICSVESALYRRDARTFLDAVSMILSFCIANGLALLLILKTSEPWPLAIAPLLNPILTMLWALVFRRTRYAFRISRSPPIRQFVANVGAQSAVFFAISSIPLWALGATVNLDVIGQYSRAAAVTLLLATALSVAINRAVQPYWRHLLVPSEINRGIRDGFVVTAWVSFSAFGTLAATGPWIVRLWLGDGWGLAGAMCSVLAISCAFQVPVGMLTNALEMTGHFGIIRVAQLISLVGTGVPIFLLFSTKEPMFAAFASVATQSIACVVMMCGASVGGSYIWRSFDGKLSREVACLTAPIAVGLILASTLKGRTLNSQAVPDELFKIVVVSIVMLLLFVFSFEFSLCRQIFRNRVGFRQNGKRLANRATDRTPGRELM